MRYGYSALTVLFDYLLIPMSRLSPFWVLFIVSMLAGILMLLIFRFTSDQRKIRESKNRMKASLIEIMLFKNSPRIILSAQKNLLWYNAQYMKHAFRPMLFMILPVCLLLIQLDGWLGYRPLRIGETAIFSVRLSEGGPTTLSRISIEADKGLTVETPPMRIPENGEVDWRIRADVPGEHTITVNGFGQRTPKKVLVNQSKLTRVARFMVGSSFWDVLLNPGEGAIDKSSYIKRIGVGYPSREIEIFGWRSHWLLPFFVLSIAGGFLFRRFLKTEI